MSESARGEGGRVWVPKILETNKPRDVPENERFTSLKKSIHALVILFRVSRCP